MYRKISTCLTMSIKSIAEEAAKVLETFNKRIEDDSRPVQQLNAADRMRQGPRAVQENTNMSFTTQHIAERLRRINPADINGPLGRRAVAVHPNEASDEDMMKAIFREVEVESNSARQIRLED